jgi:mycothiol synthase
MPRSIFGFSFSYITIIVQESVIVHLTGVQTRPYNEQTDFPSLRDFFIALGADAQRTGTWHLGNLVVGLYFEPLAIHDIQLWHDAHDSLIGLGWYDIWSGWLGIQLHPQWQDNHLLKAQILMWGEAQGQTHSATTPIRRIQVVALAHDPEYMTFLTHQGFVRESFTLLRMQRTLTHSINPIQLSEGWEIRHIRSVDEAPLRAILYRDVWGQSKLELAGYQRMQRAMDYRAELDLVVVAPDGNYVALCTCWFDPVNRTGLIEPMGTLPTFRRGGYGRAVLTEGLQRLQALGAREVFITVDADAQPARQLYETMGFQTVTTEYHYAKAIHEL